MAPRQLTPTEIADLLRDAIREGVLAPGQPLVQQSLARKVGVSRIPLREALRTLESEGLIELPHGRSGSVIRLNVDELLEIYELRSVLEPRLAELIISGARPKDIVLLRDLQSQMDLQRRRNAEQWSKANSRFHLHMYELTGRTRTVHIVEQLMNLIEPYARLYLRILVDEGTQHNQAEREHGQMVEFIETGDVEGLSAVIRAHILHASQRLTSNMRAAESADTSSRWGKLLDDLSLAETPE